MQSVGALLVMLLLSSVCRHAVAQGLALQSEDYRAARSHFRTRLVRHGPAPQKGQPLHSPPGALQVEYSRALHLQAWISPPKNGQSAGAKQSAVLFLHGGLALAAADWKSAQSYRDAGYIVMMPALRGENGQQGDYSMFYNEVTDVLAAADYLATLPYVDANRLYLAGHSVGGTLTLLASMASSRFRAAAAFSGAPDTKAWSQSRPELIVFSPKNLREFQMRSPIAFAGSFKCPVCLFCGDKEPFFTTYSRQLSARAQKKGLDVSVLRVPGNHFSAVPAEIKQSLWFFQTH